MNTETIIYNLEQVVKLLKEQNMLLKRVFNSRDAALYLGISRDHLYHLTGKNLVPCYKMNGHRLYFSHEELERWLLSVKKGKKAKAEAKAKEKAEEKAKKAKAKKEKAEEKENHRSRYRPLG